MGKIFSVSSSASIGCTFLDWSIHWLSGEDTFYNINSGNSNLTNNPLTSTNAHNHPRNVASGYQQVVDTINILETPSDNNLSSIYFTALNLDEVIKELNTTSEYLKISEGMHKIFNHRHKDYADIWGYLNKKQIPIVYLKLTYPDSYSFLEIRSLDRQILNSNLPYNSNLDMHDDILNIYGDIGIIDTIWDKRERLALFFVGRLKNIPVSTVDDFIDFSSPHLWLDAQQLWYYGEDALMTVMKFLNITINDQRLVSWRPIYLTWQNMQLNLLKFHWNVDYMCECIVNNRYHDLSNYKLQLWHEAYIQSILIYKYGLNLKIWQLTCFPDNTQDLHKLLEPNKINIE